MKAILIALVVMLGGCDWLDEKIMQRGNYHEPCRKDATCKYALVCDNNWCRSRQEVEANKKEEAERPAPRCTYQSECFCMTCADKCGKAGVKLCAYSDTSVWGSKPSVCECH